MIVHPRVRGILLLAIAAMINPCFWSMGGVQSTSPPYLDDDPPVDLANVLLNGLIGCSKNHILKVHEATLIPRKRHFGRYTGFAC